MVFVDTGVWYARFVSRDPDHERAVRLIDEHAGTLVTSDYIVDELLTLLQARGEARQIEPAGTALLETGIADVVWVTQHDFLDAWYTIRTYRDKAWSFTDCVSRAMMTRLEIGRAIAFDAHFRQFGTVEVLA